MITGRAEKPETSRFPLRVGRGNLHPGQRADGRAYRSSNMENINIGRADKAQVSPVVMGCRGSFKSPKAGGRDDKSYGREAITTESTEISGLWLRPLGANQ